MKKYIKPTSESISLLFGSDVADQLIASSKTSGTEQYSDHTDFGDGWDDFAEE